jgi:hypothetical protein
MAIIQISKIQARVGNLVDLPQLDDGELGWATDEKKLYIGKTNPAPAENVEVLTSYSNINFSQLSGSDGNLNITNPVHGEILAYDGNNWVNAGGAAAGLVTLGNASNVKITGGVSGYVLQTDGSGNLSWVSNATSGGADLAEYYEADQEYEPGTVLAFGGDKEVTIAEDGTTRVAGVVTTNPAYIMNSLCPGVAVAIALQGRVPCKVRGRIRKGDMMVSAGSGFARPWNNPHMGTVIGKALENFDGVEGVIEVAVGRL